MVLHREGQWYYTTAVMPPQMKQAWHKAGCTETPITEIVALVLALAPFPKLLQGALWISFSGSKKSNYALEAGNAGVEDLTTLVGRFWLTMNALDVAWWAYTVAPRSNIAEGPTRCFWSDVTRLQAKKTEPRLPAWMAYFWAPVREGEQFADTQRCEGIQQPTEFEEVWD